MKRQGTFVLIAMLVVMLFSMAPVNTQAARTNRVASSLSILKRVVTIKP